MFSLKKLHPSVSLVICAILWSTGGFLIKKIDWNSIAITGTRSLIAIIFMCVALKKKPRFKQSNKKETLDLWLGAFCYACTMLLFVAATKMTTAANAILLQYTNPIWIVLFAPLLLSEKNRKSDYFAILGVFVGMLLFFSEGLGNGNFLGDIIAALSGVAMGFMSIFMRRQKNASPEDSFILSHIITFVLAFPFLFCEKFPNGNDFFYLLALGIVQIGLPSILYSIGIKGESALSSMLISMLEPLMNPIWVFLFIKEMPSFMAIVGGSIILSSIILRTYVQSRKKD